MPDQVDCSIVILSHNGRAFTDRCVRSLLHSDPLPRELLVVDNGSTDGTEALMTALQPLVTAAGVRWVSWRNAENKGCSVARNEAWARAGGRYVVFLDNDTAICTRAWLGLLVGKMDADPNLGVLGPKLIYPYAPHPIQCAGVAISPRGRIRFRGRGAPRHSGAYAREEDVQALISACWMMRHAYLWEIGGLDPLFHPVQYEDLDFCMRVIEAGYACRYTPDVEVYHFEGMTTAAFGDDNYVRVIAANSTKFRCKWRHVIRTFAADPADYRWLPREALGLSGELDLSQR